MGGMRIPHRAIFLLAICFLLAALPAAAQSGAIVFAVQITPSTGLAEPVRGLPFYLLRKSFADIQKEADASAPKLDLNHFVDGLAVSKELKAWMKKHHSVEITGRTFRKSLTADDILNVPEFWKAYFDGNTSGAGVDFPARRYNERDRTRKPEKYKREVHEYNDKIRKYLSVNPDSTEVMDLSLESIDPGPRWADMVAVRAANVRRIALDLAQSRYLAAQAQTDMNGRGEFNGISPGTYWISSLNIEGLVGDTREKWDVAVLVRPGTTTQTILSNFNAVPPDKSIP